MIKVRVRDAFKEKDNNNIERGIGEKLIYENERAKDLIGRGYCEFVQEIKEEKKTKDKKEKEIEIIEVAVKEEKKEKAVKEKAVRKNAKK